MPAGRVYVAKVLTDLAKSRGWARYSEKKRPSYESSNPPSFIKRRSGRIAAKFNKLSLRSRLGGTHFVNTINRELDDNMDQLDTENSHVELVEARRSLDKV